MADTDREPASEAPQIDLRTALLQAAAERLARGGAQELSARKLAEDVGASTKVVYSHFGGMPGVIRQVYARAFSQLAEALEAADHKRRPGPQRLVKIAHAYRRFARDNRVVFELMYGRRARELMPMEDDRAPAAASLDVIAGVYRDAGLPWKAARAAAYRFWASIHGPVSLEVTEWIDDAGVFEAILARLIAAPADPA